MNVRWSIWVILFLLIACQRPIVNVVELSCNLNDGIPVVNSNNVKLGWQLMSEENGTSQSAYQIMVALSREAIENNVGDVWDTKKVQSNQSQHIQYSGLELQSEKRYFWKVRVWDQNDEPSEWSELACWDVGILDINDWNAKWIGAIKKADSKLPEGNNWPKYGISKKLWPLWTDSVVDQARMSIQLRKEFAANKKVKIAKVYISGLGHYELTINGEKIGDSQFAPLWSSYDKTVYYNVYDVTSKLLEGNNALGVLLGNGMYNVTGTRYTKFWGSYGPPTLLFKLNIEYEDGTKQQVTSDETWKYKNSPIVFNCIYGGEDYDARIEENGWDKTEFDENHWKGVLLIKGPNGKLVAQTAPEVKIMEKFPVKEKKYSGQGFYLLDMGQNLSGFPEITVKGKRGQTIVLKVSERIKDDSLATQKQTGGPHIYKYTLKGDGVEVWHPRFSYYGFQYIQVEGVNYQTDNPIDTLPELLDIQSCFIHSNTKEVGKFECSSELYRKVDWLINNAIKSNMQAVFTDCPHREKLGWIEEDHLIGPGILFTYDAGRLYSKILNDMADSQTEKGLIPNIAPEYLNFGGVFRDTPEWGSSIIINPELYHEYYGDDSMIKNYYPAMKKYFDYLVKKSNSLIIETGLGDWYDFGKERSGFPQNTPIALPATAYMYHDAIQLSKYASMLGKDDDVSYFNIMAEDIKLAYNNRFFNAQTKQYATGSQASNAISLYMGLVDDENKSDVIQNLISDIRNHGNKLTTGDVGTRYLFQALAQEGYNNVVYDLTHHYDSPGYGYQLKYGLTTLTENWDPNQGASWNHFMMGHIKEWFYKELGGIHIDTENPGFKHYILKPSVVGDITWVNCEYESIYGNIVSNWKIDDNSFEYRVEIPVNSSATIDLPNMDVNTLLINSKSIEAYTVLDDNGTFTLKSGSYIINVALNM